MSEQKELKELFDLLEETKQETIKSIEALASRIVPGETLKESYSGLAKKVEHLRQLVEEYKQYKDPILTQDAIRNLQGMADRFSVQIAEINRKFKDFESKNWFRILSDEEIKQQYINGGKPTMTVIAKHFKTTPENAFNYVHAKVKDDRIRWDVYRFFGGA